MRPVLPAVLRIILLAFLGVSSSAILYATAMNERTVESLADRSLESTALALSTATESALRAAGGGTDSEVQGILSDRVVAYALIAERDGAIRCHTNPGMTGTRLPEDPGGWLRTGRPSGRRVVLGTGLPAYEYDFILHPLDGGPELLRIVLHTTKADGTGLGLAYSKKAIEGMGGSIGIRNRDEGNGAVLWLRLPGKG